MMHVRYSGRKITQGKESHVASGGKCRNAVQGDSPWAADPQSLRDVARVYSDKRTTCRPQCPRAQTDSIELGPQAVGTGLSEPGDDSTRNAQTFPAFLRRLRKLSRTVRSEPGRPPRTSLLVTNTGLRFAPTLNVRRVDQSPPHRFPTKQRVKE